MTQFGHLIIGISCGSLTGPPKLTRLQRMLLILLFASAANIPDIAVKGWGHDKYYFSHSVFVSLALIGFLFAAWFILCSFFKRDKHYRVVISLAFAWLSHLLLDSFYNHGLGIRIFWPISDSALSMPMPWLNVKDVSIPFFAWHNTKIYLIEILTFVPILFLCLLLRYFKFEKGNKYPGSHRV